MTFHDFNQFEIGKHNTDNRHLWANYGHGEFYSAADSPIALMVLI